jgi:hypothetical protein
MTTETAMMVIIYFDQKMLNNQETQHIRIDITLGDNTKKMYIIYIAVSRIKNMEMEYYILFLLLHRAF